MASVVGASALHRQAERRLGNDDDAMAAAAAAAADGDEQGAKGVVNMS